MNVIYEVNGKKFTDKKEAEVYEKTLISRDERRKELDAARDNYFKLLKKYNDDYCNNNEEDTKHCTSIFTSSDLRDLMEELFGV